jgi:scyllo-inositol 2-dehydrogenase (NADP+)
MTSGKDIGCGVIGFGPAFNMGRYHCELISSTPGLRLVSICDSNPERLRAAQHDFPTVKTYPAIEGVLSDPAVEAVTVVTPHNTHAALALKAINSGKNVIVEKPMCLTIEEADGMISAARGKGVTLTVFHNRRLDGDFLAMKDIVDRGVIGKVFHIEAYGGGYGHPGHWWRSDKEISGGAFYDWGAHFLDWTLDLLGERIVGVNGHFHKLVWDDVTNEDQVEALISFESGALADVQLSSIAIVGKPKWRILGTKGGILDTDSGETSKLYIHYQGYNLETTVNHMKTDWRQYYVNFAEHLLHGKELLVKPEEARRVIAVMQMAERSSRTGRTEVVPHEDEFARING